MIGDRKHDVEGARKNGVDFIGVSFGFAPEGEFEQFGVDKVADNHIALLLEAGDRGIEALLALRLLPATVIGVSSGYSQLL